MTTDPPTRITVTIPGPPVAKQRPRFRVVPGPKPFVSTYTPPETRKYEQHVAACLLAEIERVGWDYDPEDQYRVSIDIYRAAKRGDIDQFVKSSLDGSNKVAWHDDRLVRELSVRMFDDKQNPRLEITIEKL